MKEGKTYLGWGCAAPPKSSRSTTRGRHLDVDQEVRFTDVLYEGVWMVAIAIVHARVR
jgi:hypothetical protein